MIRYDEMNTRFLILVSRQVAEMAHWTPLARDDIAAMLRADADRLEAFLPYTVIVAALRALPATAVYDPATNTCRLCDWIDGEHTDTCPWALAQQTGSGGA